MLIMNIFTLLVLLLVLASGYFVGGALYPHYGLLGWIFGFAIGSSVLVVAYYLIIRCSKAMFPSQPPCRKGKCLSDDYKVAKYDLENGTVVFECKCGARYLQKSPYFRELLSDGSDVPYMKRTGIWGRWEKEA
jgi:hypothetical protein